MKAFLILMFCFTIQSVQAGSMSAIPMELVEIDNQGRRQFLANISKVLQLKPHEIKYRNLRSIVVGGDEEGADHLGGYFIYETTIFSYTEGFEQYKCHQFLSVGNFDTGLTRPIECERQ
jgi:hypothetical protein